MKPLLSGITRWHCPCCGEQHDTFKAAVDQRCQRCGNPMRATAAAPSKVRPGFYSSPPDVLTLGQQLLQEAQR
jgi:tRNA(Ile2) C34 agmatinyltransferase TiaS